MLLPYFVTTTAPECHASFPAAGARVSASAPRIKGLSEAFRDRFRDSQIMLYDPAPAILLHLNIYAFIRLQANRQFVLRQVFARDSF